MKRFLAMVLTLAMLLSMVPAMALVTSAETATEDNTDVKPFYALTWSSTNRRKFSNMDEMINVRVAPERPDKGVKACEPEEIYLSFNGFNSTTELDAMAQSLKNVLDDYPEGMRYILLTNTGIALQAGADYIVYADAGIAVLKAQVTALMEKLAALGAKLDGVILDTEYVAMGSWYIYGKEYYGGYGGLYEPSEEDIAAYGLNRNIYNDIVADSRYATEIRPLLEERGFKFYEEIGGNKSEIWSMFPTQYLSAEEKVKYANCYTIWNTVMTVRKNAYLNEAVYEPLKASFPNAILSDYQQADTNAWLKSPSDDGGKGYLGGNSMKVGNTSNYNTYSNRPSNSFFMSDTEYLYKNPAAYNKAVYEDDPYNAFMWDTNKFKSVYAAADNELFNAWIAVYDYNTDAGSAGNTAYYAETVLHLGMLDPEPFLIYCAKEGEFDGNEDEYNVRMQVIDELMKELTRVAGYADREPIETPAAWNDGFVLSGMYTGGRNLWRLTPDTTDGTTLESFKVSDQAPTFTINGATITFPSGRIIADGEISKVGTCGYWIETPADVTPVITYDADRYANNPSFAEDFEGYAVDDGFGEVGTVDQKWEATDIAAWIVESADGLALELSGTGTLNNIKLPANITAGDSYAKQQAWEVSLTLAAETFEGTLNLLTCNGDAGVLLKNGVLYIGEDALTALAAETKYTLKREVNFDTNTSTYTVYLEGKEIARMADVTMAVELPVSTIGFACENLAEYTVQIDDYKLYPTGLAQDLSVYNAATGIQLTTETTDVAEVAYRLSWMNATAEGKKVNVVAECYDSEGNVATKIIYKTVEMAPGADGVVTGTIANTYASVKVYLEDAGTYTPGTAPEDGDYDWTASLPTVAPTEPVATEPVTTEPTTAPETEPTETPTEPAEGEKASVAIMSWDATLTVTYGGSPVYARCYAAETVYYTADGVENGTRWRATTSGANAETWNIKYEWPIGGVPTLTFKDVTLDIIGDDGKTMYEKVTTTTTDEETGETTETVTYKQLASMSAILPKTCHDLKLVLIGNNHVEANYGIIRGTVSATQYFKNVTIVGEDGGKLSGFGRSFNLRPGAGYDLTIENAVLDLEFATGAGGEAIPIYTDNGDIHIINSTITCGNEKNVAINAAGTGSIYIHRSTVNATATLTGPSAGSGAINAPGGTVTITGNSKITANGTNCCAIYGALGVTVNGGELNLNGAEVGINGGEGEIRINAGVMEITADKAFSAVPVLADDIVAYAGPSAEHADYYNETKYKAKYVQTIGHLHTEVAIPAVAETCTTDGCEDDGIICSVCNEIQVASTVIPATGHTEEALPAVAATCNKTGLTAGVKCTTCGDILTAQEVVPALGHSYVTVAAREATCTEIGLTAGEICSICGDAKVYQEVIPALGHTEEVIAGVEATDTEPGLTEGKKCSVCGEILVAQEIIPVKVADAETVTLRVQSTTQLSATEGGSAVYTKNQEYTLTDSGGTEFTGTKQVSCTADDDWNIKFEYPAGGVPTLTLKGAVIDHYNNSTSKYSSGSIAAIISDDGDNIPLKVVIAENSTFETNYGIIRGAVSDTNYFTDITITSIGNAKLTARGGEVGISVKDGYDLALKNANLDLYANGSSGTAIPINTSNGDITINGGNINIVQDNGLGMSARTSGNITITNAIVRVTAKGAANNGAINVPSGTVVITNSIVEAFRPSSAGKGIQATSVTINSGYVHALAPYWGIDANPITINGGTVISETTVKKAPGYTNADGSWNNNNWNKALVRSPIVTGYACFDVVIQDGDSVTERNNTLGSADYWKDYVKIYHKLTEVPAVAATCDTDGTVRHWTCPDCGNNYADAEGKTLLESVVDPAGHDWAEATCTAPKTCKLCGITEGMAIGHLVEIIPGYAKTCTTDGLSDGKKCTVCGEVVVAQEVIPAGHDIVILPAVAPTDTHNGLTEGKKCSTCGEILVVQEVDPATATLTGKLRMRSGDITLVASTDGKSTYLVNKEIDCYYNVTTTTTAEDGTETTTTEQVAFKGTNLVVLASNTETEPEGWTVKYSYPKGGVPTLTLRGAVLDYFDEESGKYSAHTSRQIAIYRDSTVPVYDLHIVIEEDSYIATSSALLTTDSYIGNVTVSSVGDATLTARNSKGIGAANGNLTLNNANLSIEVPKYNGNYSWPLSAKGDIVFNGGSYKLFSNNTATSGSWDGAVGSLIRSVEGEIVINDGIFDLDTRYYSGTGSVGAIHAMGTNGKLTVNGGIIDINHELIPAVNATNGILMTGGIFRTETTGTMYALPKVYGAVTMTGGTLELWCENGGCTGDAGIIDWSALSCCVAQCGTYKGATNDLGDFTDTHRYIKIAEHANTTEIAGKDATCTEPGLSVGTRCADCGEIVVKQETIPATGHTEADAVKENETATSYDSVVYCSVCGTEMSRETIETGCAHTNTTTTEKVVTAATCTTAGTKTITVVCDDCGETVSETTEEIPATGEHVLDDENDITCNNCFVFEVTNSNMVVAADGNTAHSNHRVKVFYLGKQTVEDITDDAALTAAAVTTPLTYSGFDKINKVELAEAGNYVLHMIFTGADGLRKTIPMQVIISTVKIDGDYKIVAVDSQAATHDRHRVTVYYLGTQDVENYTDETVLQTIDPDAVTYIGEDKYSKASLTEAGNYVLVFKYRDENKVWQYVYRKLTVTMLTISATNKLVLTDTVKENANHRVEVYYLGAETIENYTDITAVAAIAKSAETYSGLEKIAKVELKEAGNYVLNMRYTGTDGLGKSHARFFTVTTINVNGDYNLVVGDIGTTANHRVTPYYLGTQTVEDPTDVNALAAIDPEAETYETIDKINKVTLDKAGNYVLFMQYTGTDGLRKTVVREVTNTLLDVDATNTLVVQDVVKENINHRVTIYYLGTQEVEDYTNEEALKAVDSNPVYFGVGEMEAMNNYRMDDPGEYVLILKFTGADGYGRTFVRRFTVTTLTLDENNTVVLTDVSGVNANHRMTVYYLGDMTVDDPTDEATLKAIDSDAVLYGADAIAEGVQLTEEGNFVVLMYYTGADGLRKTLVMQGTI